MVGEILAGLGGDWNSGNRKSLGMMERPRLDSGGGGWGGVRGWGGDGHCCGKGIPGAEGRQRGFFFARGLEYLLLKISDG